MAIRKVTLATRGPASFTTIQTDTGTSPVATGASDTLTLTSSNIGIAGNSGTDTITFTAQTAGASTAGYVSTSAQTMGDGFKTFQKGIVSGRVTLTDGATVDIDASLGNLFTLITSNNPTINIPTNPTSWQKMMLAIRAQSSDRTVTLTTGSTGAFKYTVGITGLPTVTASTYLYLFLVYNPTETRWIVLSLEQGT